MVLPEQFESAKFRTLDVILHEGYDRAALEKAVASLTGGEPWIVRPVPHAPTGREFDLLPPGTVEPASAWELARRLLADPCVKDADPAFEAVYAEQGAALDVPPAGGPAAPKAEIQTAGPETFNEDDCDWSVRFVKADEAWKLSSSAASQGEGILIGHPDSGYLRHSELGPNFKPELGWDFIDDDKTTENAGGGHGLGTASVISSPHDDAGTGDGARLFVDGIAPDAETIPLRVAKPNLFVPSPVLFNVGVDRLRDALWFAIERRLHVISVSLGWLPNAGLHRAIQQAVRENIIVIAAAGNYTGPIVVWPGAYDEVVTLAACNASAEPWAFSSWGRAVDATGPGEKVWTAQPGDKVEQSSGTSYATAIVAGIAALWLAYHGRDQLLARYQGGATLAQVFRHVLRATCEPWPRSEAAWGAGLVNAKACLESPLPDISALEPLGMKSLGKGASDTVAATFSGLPEADVRRGLATTLGVDEQKAARLDMAYGRELRFWALSHPGFRRALREGAGGARGTFGAAALSTLPPFSPSLLAAIR
ncbi:S8 family peptidase [Corallococcus carmarthensis]|uniref:Peptidase S8 and S53, subtilisin, kexin, sedolisin n=1 Tax=Corallococcus carmarthensis TaxID=2316728 RepID=A0A3A8JJE1_9BACT|nr:S8 family serine peptidase [Corallococcus carmarthensis]NOK18185.1 S8 family serine peptidase [Corallococcus carmarthensis]RKG95829.1 peptidase S8 and S53, subtilisin, kexin, sedolisin [Corallococcus carmarthensis]